MAVALPQVTVDTTYPGATGTVHAVTAGGDLQGTLNSAQPGDIVSLAAGATFQGPFTLPAKSGTGWVLVVSSAVPSLPSPGSRVRPGNASLMPKIVGPQNAPALQAAGGAHHYRLVGLEISPAAPQHTLIELGGASHIVVDRCYIHGQSGQGGTLWGLRADAAWMGIVDSYLENFRDTVNEATAIKVVDSPGPVKIQNCFIEAAGQSVMFGGQDPSTAGLVTQDIEIRGNWMTKRLSWQIGFPTYAGIPVIVKNVFELKNARRALIDSNILENNWRQADQDGFAVVFTPRNQTGGAPWATVQDVTFSRNIVRHSTAGFHMLGTDYTNPSGPLARVLVQNNLLYDIGAFASNGGSVGTVIQMRDGVQNATIDHNTAFGGTPLHAQVVNGTPNPGLVFTNNISAGNVTADGAGDPASALARSWPGATFTKNVLLDGTANAYPAGNWTVPGTTPIVNAFSGGSDYHLVPGSPYKAAGTDGLDVGANIDAVMAATANVVSGVPSSPPPPPPGIVTPTWTVDFTATGGTITVMKNGVIVYSGGS